MPLVINSLRGGHTHKHIHTHAHTFWTEAILGNQARVWFKKLRLNSLLAIEGMPLQSCKIRCVYKTLCYESGHI